MASFIHAILNHHSFTCALGHRPTPDSADNGGHVALIVDPDPAPDFTLRNSTLLSGGVEPTEDIGCIGDHVAGIGIGPDPSPEIQCGEGHIAGAGVDPEPSPDIYCDDEHIAAGGSDYVALEVLCSGIVQNIAHEQKPSDHDIPRPKFVF